MEHHDILKQAPIFCDALEAGHFEGIADRCELRRVGRSTVLMRQGDYGASMFVIVSGSLAVEVSQPGGVERVATLGPGDIVGEMSLLTGAPRTATVTAAKKSEVLEIGKDALQRLVGDNPGLVKKFATLVAQRDGELRALHQRADLWNSHGMHRDEIAARMTAFYSD